MFNVTVQGSFSYLLSVLWRIPFPQQYFVTNCLIPIITCFVLMSCVVIHLALLVSPYFFQSAMKGTSNSMSLPNRAVPGEALSTGW